MCANVLEEAPFNDINVFALAPIKKEIGFPRVY